MQPSNRFSSVLDQCNLMFDLIMKLGGGKRNAIQIEKIRETEKCKEKRERMMHAV